MLINHLIALVDLAPTMLSDVFTVSAGNCIGVIRVVGITHWAGLRLSVLGLLPDNLDYKQA